MSVLEFLDGRKVVKSLRALAFSDGSAIPYHAMVSPEGIPLGPDNPLVVSIKPPGSTGLDFSANAPAVGGTLLIEFPPSATRTFLEIQNQSAGVIQVVRDDGLGGNLTVILLAPSPNAGEPGQGWKSSTFRGRVRVFGAANAQIGAYQD